MREMFWKKMPSAPVKVVDLTKHVGEKPFWMLAVPAPGEPGNPDKGVGDISDLERALAKLLVEDFEFNGHCIYKTRNDAAKVATAIKKIFPRLFIIPVGPNVSGDAHEKSEPV